MKKVLILVLAALVVSSVAVTAASANLGKSAPKVNYILKGKITAYTPYNPVGPVNGSVTITVSSANYHGKALKGQSLTFVVDAKTKVTLSDGVFAANDKGIVKIRAAKRIAPANLAATLQATDARQIIDQQ
jgi:hypothetical protein